MRSLQMATYRPSAAMRRHLEVVDKDPSKAMDLSPELRRELDSMTDADLGEMAQSVKYSRGEPIHLTDEQNAAFREQNQHLPTFGKKAGPVPKAPPGKFAGQGEAPGQSMSDAWAKFGGSKEAFKAEVFKPVPLDCRIGRQEWLVQGVCYSKDGKVAILNGGAVYDADHGKAHAERLQKIYPWFDFHVVSQWSWIPMPMDEETARGVQRTYKDKNLNAIMDEHFKTSTSAKQRQLEQVREVEANKGPRAETEPEFPPTQVQTNMIDDDAADGEVEERKALPRKEASEDEVIESCSGSEDTQDNDRLKELEQLNAE